MISRKENILNSALKLFAEQGFRATTTSQISSHAGVSEALIFRHYKNKEGLLQAILTHAKDKIQQLVDHFRLEKDPKQRLRTMLEYPFQHTPENEEYWLLLMKIKWELNMTADQKMEPVQDILTETFEELGIPHAKQEADFLTHYIEGLNSAILRKEVIEEKETKDFLFRKYNL